MRACILILLGLCLLASPTTAHAQSEHSHEAGDLGRVGQTHFPVACAPGLQGRFDRAVAVLHSFFYEESERQFASVAAQDPGCAMAWWGVAMSLWHPLWEPPDSASLARGWTAIQRADSIGADNERERAYISALASFYRDGDHVGHRTRALAYERAMERLHAQFPADTEAAIFYALALNSTLQYGDKTYAQQLRAGSILEPIYATQQDHPGVAHYLIHSYDFPTLAARALPMARHYAELAPHVPHALHMPSHIFTRLGMWDESILSNLAAAQAGREYSATHHAGAVYYDAVHAWDYLEYAYLQRAQDRKAREIRDSVTAIRRVSHQTQSFYYALTSVPARYPLERHAWSEAAALELPSGWSWNRYPWTEATTHFARALGGARSGRPDIARSAIARLTTIRDAIVNPVHRDWAQQVEVQRGTAAAWLALSEGHEAQALQGMRAAAALEDSTEKRPVTPGAVLPARELLGDMLLRTHHASEALAAYEAVLRDAPGRFNALMGASRAAMEVGRRDMAKRYAAELIVLAKDGDRERPELAAARRIYKGARSPRN
ncbi:MAG: hypothetical protein ABIU54_11805 [Candidatus Eisenbacteria bacterium]